MDEQQFLWNVNYWTEMFERVNEDLEPIVKKLSEAPIPDLTYEERFRLREALAASRSYTRLLREDVNKFDSPETQPFYKRLFHRK